MPPENNTCFPFPQQLSQLPQSTESEAGGWGGESYKEIRESLTSLGRSMGCFTRQMEKDQHYLSFICSHTLRAACSAATVDSLSGCHGVVNVGFVALLVFEGAALFSFILNCHNMFLNLNLFCTDGAWSLGKWSLNWFIKIELGYEKRYFCAALIPNTHFKKIQHSVSTQQASYVLTQMHTRITVDFQVRLDLDTYGVHCKMQLQNLWVMF